YRAVGEQLEPSYTVATRLRLMIRRRQPFRMRNALMLLMGDSWAREQAGFSSRDRASAVEPNLPSPFLRGDTMKRTTGLCLTVGFILAVVFLFQLSTSASHASSSVNFSKDLA